MFLVNVSDNVQDLLRARYLLNENPERMLNKDIKVQVYNKEFSPVLLEFVKSEQTHNTDKILIATTFHHFVYELLVAKFLV